MELQEPPEEDYEVTTLVSTDFTPILTSRVFEQEPNAHVRELIRLLSEEWNGELWCHSLEHGLDLMTRNEIQYHVESHIQALGLECSIRQHGTDTFSIQVIRRASRRVPICCMLMLLALALAVVGAAILGHTISDPDGEVTQDANIPSEGLVSFTFA